MGRGVERGLFEKRGKHLPFACSLTVLPLIDALLFIISSSNPRASDIYKALRLGIPCRHGSLSWRFGHARKRRTTRTPAEGAIRRREARNWRAAWSSTRDSSSVWIGIARSHTRQRSDEGCTVAFAEPFSVQYVLSPFLSFLSSLHLGAFKTEEGWFVSSVKAERDKIQSKVRAGGCWDSSVNSRI